MIVFSSTLKQLNSILVEQTPILPNLLGYTGLHLQFVSWIIERRAIMQIGKFDSLGDWLMEYKNEDEW